MEFGMPTLIETETLKECAELCKELGLQFIELNMNLPQYQVGKINISEFLDIADKYDIYYTIHLDENLNPCDFNERVAAAYTETVLQTIEIAKQLAVSVLNMHISDGVYFTMPDRKAFLFEQYKEIFLEKLKHFRDICDDAITDSNIKICIENCGGYKEFQRAGIDMLLQSKNFALTYDIGHGYCRNFPDEEFITERQNRLCHMHIHDGSNGKDHLALGTGEIDILKYLKLAKENHCRCVLETKTIEGLKQSVGLIRN